MASSQIRTWCGAVVCGVVAVTSLVLDAGQAPRPQLPGRLLQQADLVHRGSFALPDTEDFEFTRGVIAFNAARNSLFVVGHDHRQQVAEVTIPAAGGRAEFLQPFRDALEGRLEEITPSESADRKIGGMFVAGDRLVVSAYVYYDASRRAESSHFVRSADLSVPGVSNPFTVGGMGLAFTAGYFAPIPVPWQAALGGDVFNGQCCLSIISRTSYGPAVFSTTAATLVAGRGNVNATPLVAYPEDRQNLGPFDGTSDVFNGTSKIAGVVLPEDTASVLFIGKHGTGEYCYGPGDKCKDPDDADSGNHAYPYRAQVWAYDANELATVKAGRRRPWDVKPYAVWGLPGLDGVEIGGVAVDPSTKRIFVAENYADDMRLRIHIFGVNGQ